jgi:GH25 family lysozyme M1 (1,4-beta-N-acetylmuramidase)
MGFMLAASVDWLSNADAARSNNFCSMSQAVHNYLRNVVPVEKSVLCPDCALTAVSKTIERVLLQRDPRTPSFASL